MILDEDRLRSERSDRKLWKSRVTGLDEYAPQAIAGPSERPPRERRPTRAQRPDEEDAEYRLAIEASKNEAEEERRRRDKTASRNADDDDDLAKAIRLSKEEEELRRRELEDNNAASLFDDTPAPAQSQPTGYNQGYQQQGAVDWFGNPVDQQQPQTTGYLNNQYSQPTGFQPQQTGFQNGNSNGFGSQPTGFDQPQFQQQQPNYLQQQPTIQPQQTAFNNPYAGQQQQQQPSSDIFGMQSPQASFPQSGNNNPWATNQQQPEALRPAPTGSNNPFAQSTSRPQFGSVQSGPPTLSTLAEQKTATQFNQPQFNQPNPIQTFQAPQSPQRQQTAPQNPQHARLNALLASGEGQDTFGNTGDLRIPSQHTAPGTFVNSAGGGMDRLRAAQTGGNNPFFQQQFTGAPQQQQSPFGAQPPAQTGPAGANGFGGGFGQQHNPFGARPQPQQSNSLIDF